MSLSPEEQISSRQRMSAMMEVHVKEALEKLDADPSSSFNVNIESMIDSCNHRFHSFSVTPGYWAVDLHDLWRLYITCAKGTLASDTQQDKRVLQILELRERGVITRKAGKDSQESLTEEGERIWVDLPYLAPDFQKEWENLQGIKSNHIVNLAAFTARLASAGIRENELTVCMLQLTRHVLETEWQAGGPPLTELLPAITQWFSYCKEKVYRLCVSNQSFAGDERVSPGPLAQTADVQDSGFSVARWLFWRKAVKDFALSKDEKLAKEGKLVFDHMMGVGRSNMNRLPGESSYWNKVDQAMHQELRKRNGPGAVTMDDVKIDLNWVDEADE